MERMELVRHVDASPADLLAVLTRPGHWLEVFAAISAARGEGAAEDAARRSGVPVPARRARVSTIAIGEPTYALDRWEASTPFRWETSGYPLLLDVLEGTLYVVADESGGTSLSFEGEIDGDALKRRGIEVALRMLLDAVAEGVQAQRAHPA